MFKERKKLDRDKLFFYAFLIIALSSIIYLAHLNNLYFSNTNGWYVLYFNEVYEKDSNVVIDFTVENYDKNDTKFLYTVYIDTTPFIKKEIEVISNVTINHSINTSKEFNRISVDLSKNNVSHKIYVYYKNIKKT